MHLFVFSLDVGWSFCFSLISEHSTMTKEKWCKQLRECEPEAWLNCSKENQSVTCRKLWLTNRRKSGGRVWSRQWTSSQKFFFYQAENIASPVGHWIQWHGSSQHPYAGSQYADLKGRLCSCRRHLKDASWQEGMAATSMTLNFLLQGFTCYIWNQPS